MAYEKKLIEGNFPCGIVGAETRRERSAVNMLPPDYYLHVWWARRPLTASRAAILGSILPADTKADDFIKLLGIKNKQVNINGIWVDLPDNIKNYDFNTIVDVVKKENKLRKKLREVYNTLISKDESLVNNVVVLKLKERSLPVHEDFTNYIGKEFDIREVPANSVWFNDLMSICSNFEIRVPNLYGYDRAYKNQPDKQFNDITVLDCTAGGGSIPFEAMRLGCNVIANDLNPVATVIEKATLEYPKKYGLDLIKDISFYADKLVDTVSEKMKPFFVADRDNKLDMSYIYCRTVTCPHCGKKAPLLNSYWLSSKDDNQWMVVAHLHGDRVDFEPVHIYKQVGPNGEDPASRTVTKGVGLCLHCHQAIDSDEIKQKACSGQMEDTLYAIAAKREIDILDKNGNVQYYKSGAKKGQKKVKKELFFRAPVKEDFDALDRAKKALEDNWDRWEAMDLIPTEKIPTGNDMRPVLYGMQRWCDMFSPRQLLGHLTAMETLHDMMPEILKEHGQDKGTAIITYLQYMIDKTLDYNSRQTMWETKRLNICHTFTRHDFSFKWCFGEMIFTGIYSGLLWGKSQVIDAYKEISDLLDGSKAKDLRILNGTAANLTAVVDDSVDVICVDPPYYNNVQYAELSDYFYVWQKRIFNDLYPYFYSRYTDKDNQAVANPVHAGNSKNASIVYEKIMFDIFKECYRVIKSDGLMTMMFTHKDQTAWETLLLSLIQAGWIITSTCPVESESSNSLHQADKASASTSIFIACRKSSNDRSVCSYWRGLGNTGVLPDLEYAVKESLVSFASLHLSPVDEMLASYGVALNVLSKNWPVYDDNDIQISPTDAMQAASRVVSHYQLAKISHNRILPSQLSSESLICLILLAFYKHQYFAYSDALNISKSLTIALINKQFGYKIEDSVAVYASKPSLLSNNKFDGYFAPLIKKDSTLRLAMPEERNSFSIDNPQTEWDVMQGVIVKFRLGDIPLVRDYLRSHSNFSEDLILDMLSVYKIHCGSDVIKKEIDKILSILSIAH